ncbi:unnamed protein product [Lasius platythorax]|uniref:Uncharacterized protein n=1 Tax=Lasius platythorax TaxID=488582 RepID=A0AAV2NHZ7_9HYME
MKHGRAMLCGPSWRGEQERRASCHILPRECRVSSSSLCTVRVSPPPKVLRTGRPHRFLFRGLRKFFVQLTETRCASDRERDE